LLTPWTLNIDGEENDLLFARNAARFGNPAVQGTLDPRLAVCSHAITLLQRKKGKETICSQCNHIGSRWFVGLLKRGNYKQEGDEPN
jgi:hypothetical protein